jgi:hypothetical protein
MQTSQASRRGGIPGLENRENWGARHRRIEKKFIADADALKNRLEAIATKALKHCVLDTFPRLA